MKVGDNGPSTGLLVAGIGAMALCCLGPLVLATVGVAGLVALLSANAWWLLGGVLVLAGAILATRINRRAGPSVDRRHLQKEEITHE